MMLSLTLEWYQEDFDTPDVSLQYKAAKNVYLNSKQCAVSDDKEAGPTGGIEESPHLTQRVKGKWCPIDPKHTRYKRCPEVKPEESDSWVSIGRTI
jgi:hypothetical protein